jgi:uncharacterized Zn finger protein
MNLTQKQQFARMVSAREILASGCITHVGDYFIVTSQSGVGKSYPVIHNARWTCGCPDFVYRKVHCKHVRAVRLKLRQRRRR